MEVILREDIDNLGTRGQVVKVAPGYARNFLLPKRLAVAATESNKKIVEQERQAHLRKEAKASGRGRRIWPRCMAGVDRHHRAEGRRKRSAVRLGDGKDIAEALTAQNYNIDRRKIQLDEPIKQLGEYKVPVRLHKDVTVEITVVVAKEE